MGKGCMTHIFKQHCIFNKWFALLWGLLLFPLVLGGCGETGEVNTSERVERQTPVAAVEVVRRDLSRQLVTSATVQPKARIRLASRTTGTLEAVLFEEGQAVRQGQVLARLDMAEQRAELARARAKEEDARQAYERAAAVRARNLVSATEYDRLRLQLRVAESERQLWQTRVRHQP
jgi:membrane fusion protein, multidrug efflux system